MTRANGLDFMDPVIDQVLNYMDRFDQSYKFLIHLNRGPVKKKCSNQVLDGQDGLKMGHKFEVKYAKFYGDQNKSLNGSD